MIFYCFSCKCLPACIGLRMTNSIVMILVNKSQHMLDLKTAYELTLRYVCRRGAEKGDVIMTKIVTS